MAMKSEEEAMSIDKIACCVDFSENADVAFDAALEMTRKFSARLYIIHVVPPEVNPIMADSLLKDQSEDRASLILKIETRMQEAYGDRVGEDRDYELVVMGGHVSTEILRYLSENDIDLVVLGAYGTTGMGLVVFGSVAKRVAHKSPCSVMIVRNREAVEG
jgi:universal stress protein A